MCMASPLRVGSALASHLSHGPPKRWLTRRGDSENARFFGGKGLNRGGPCSIGESSVLPFLPGLGAFGLRHVHLPGDSFDEPAPYHGLSDFGLFFLGKGLLLTAKLCKWNRPVLSESFQPRSCYVAWFWDGRCYK